jgi:hypothetical protein
LLKRVIHSSLLMSRYRETEHAREILTCPAPAEEVWDSSAAETYRRGIVR